jgi:hypothetical protein
MAYLKAAATPSSRSIYSSSVSCIYNLRITELPQKPCTSYPQALVITARPVHLVLNDSNARRAAMWLNLMSSEAMCGITVRAHPKGDLFSILPHDVAGNDDLP